MILVRNYLETILADLNQYSQVNRNHYEPYLALLFLFKPFSVDDVETRSLIQSLVNIDEVTEGLLRRDLEQCAILERGYIHGSTSMVISRFAWRVFGQDNLLRCQSQRHCEFMGTLMRFFPRYRHRILRVFSKHCVN